MKPARSLSQTLTSSRRSALSLFCGAVILIGASVLVRRVNHDESQYVAAIALMRTGLPYRDFAYLQTPLQPFLLSPLAYLPAGWTFIAARVASAVFGVATILLLYKTLAPRASFGAILVALASLLCTDAFLLASSLARNDALAMVLLAAALPPLLSGIGRGSPLRLALAGMLLALAASAKISAALPAAGAALFIVARGRRLGARALIGFAFGLLAGLLPTLVAAAAAPIEFRFDVFSYNFEAPVQWWTSIGEASELNPVVRAEKLIGMAAVGSVLVALAATAVDRTDTDERRILDMMIVGGLIAAYLPKPALTQYLVPVLPPLFARFALSLDAAREGWRRAFTVLAGLGSIAGLTSSFIVRSGDVELVRSIALGREVAALAHGGPVVTLSSEYVAGAGVNLDSRFAAGPFLYRTRGPLARMAQTEGRAVTVQSLQQGLDSRRPSVIFVGGEKQRFMPDYPAGLGQPLIAWGERRGYRPLQLGSGFVALVAPSIGHSPAFP